MTKLKLVAVLAGILAIGTLLVGKLGVHGSSKVRDVSGTFEAFDLDGVEIAGEKPSSDTAAC